MLFWILYSIMVSNEFKLCLIRVNRVLSLTFFRVQLLKFASGSPTVRHAYPMFINMSPRFNIWVQLRRHLRLQVCLQEDHSLCYNLFVLFIGPSRILVGPELPAGNRRTVTTMGVSVFQYSAFIKIADC